MDGESLVFSIPSVLVVQQFNGILDKNIVEDYPETLKAKEIDQFLLPDFTSFLSKTNNKETEIWYIPTHLRTKELLKNKELLKEKLDKKYYVGSTYIHTKEWDKNNYFRTLHIEIADPKSHPILRLKSLYNNGRKTLTP